MVQPLNALLVSIGVRKYAIQRYTRDVVLSAEWPPLKAEKSHMVLQEVLYLLYQMVRPCSSFA